jgi:hypothetical protein
MLHRDQLKKRVHPGDKRAPVAVSYAALFDCRVWKHKNVWVFRSDSGHVQFETLDPGTVTIKQLYKLYFP